MSKLIDLHGEEFDSNEAITKMYMDEFYYNMSVLSYSNMKHLLKSPKWFKHKLDKPDPESQALRDGSLVHTEILEPEKYGTLHFCDTSTKSTKKWKLAVEKFGKAYTYTMKEKYMNSRIVTAFLQNKKAVSFLSKSQTEVPALMSMKSIGGNSDIAIRGKADILREGQFVADVKTTSGGVGEVILKDGTVTNQFKFTIDSYDYDLQAYLYTTLFEVPDFYWLVVDKATTDIGIFKASEETLQSGKDKAEAAVALYEAFFVDSIVDLNEYYKEATL